VARLGYCEHQVFLERKYGPRTTATQEIRRREGNEAHQRFHMDALSAGDPGDFAQGRKWCFAATMAFGSDAPETRRLRTFRDQVLRRSVFGRRLIALYYRAAPALCRRVAQVELGVAVCRVLLRWCVLPVADGFVRIARLRHSPCTRRRQGDAS
jgi:hypothetical protein